MTEPHVSVPTLSDRTAELYLDELVQHAEAGLRAARLVHHAVAGLPDARVQMKLWAKLREVANAAAMVSKTLWPDPPRKMMDSDGEDKETFERRKLFVKARGPALREMLNISDDNLLKNRAVRNAIEHFDERLDLQLSLPGANVIMYNIGPPNMIHIEGATHPFHLHLYDPRTTTYSILGASMRIADVEQALGRLLEAACRETQRIEEARWNR